MMCDDDKPKRGYLNGYDLLNFLERLDHEDLIMPIAVSESVAGLTKPYFDYSDEVVYGTRVGFHMSKKQDFNGILIEGLTKSDVLKFNKGYFGGERVV